MFPPMTDCLRLFQLSLSNVQGVHACRTDFIGTFPAKLGSGARSFDQHLESVLYFGPALHESVSTGKRNPLLMVDGSTIHPPSGPFIIHLLCKFMLLCELACTASLGFHTVVF